MAERESRNCFVFGKIRESEMCVSDCIQKINMSGQAFCSWCHETIRYGPINQHFVWLFFCFKFTSYYFWYWPVSSRKRGFSPKWKSKVVEKKFLLEKKIDKHTFFPVKIKVIDLWMQIEVRKLIFFMNFSVLDFFKFASRMPQTAQIFVWTFKIFRGSIPPDPPRYFLFFFPLAILRIWVLKFLFFSNLTQSDFPLVVADRLKSMLYLYQNIFYCCTRIYIFYRSIPTGCSCQIIRDFC